MFTIAAIDADTDSWRARGESYGSSACSYWPAIAYLREQNVFAGDVAGRKDSLVTFGFDKAGNRERCQGEVLFFTTKWGLYDAGYAPHD